MRSQPNIACVVHSSACTIRFGSLACRRLYLSAATHGTVGCIWQGYPMGCSFLFDFRKLKFVEIICGCHVQSVPWFPRYVIKKFEDNFLPRTGAQKFRVLLPKTRWNKLPVFQGTSSMFLEMLIPFHKTTRRHIPGDNHHSIHRRVELHYIRSCFTTFISVYTHLT